MDEMHNAQMARRAKETGDRLVLEVLEMVDGRTTATRLQDPVWDGFSSWRTLYLEDRGKCGTAYEKPAGGDAAERLIELALDWHSYKFGALGELARRPMDRLQQEDRTPIVDAKVASLWKQMQELAPIVREILEAEARRAREQWEKDGRVLEALAKEAEASAVVAREALAEGAAARNASIAAMRSTERPPNPDGPAGVYDQACTEVGGPVVYPLKDVTLYRLRGSSTRARG